MLQSGGRYLSVTNYIRANLPSGFLKFDEEKIWSPRVKFAAEPAETGDGRLFHIRSLYNNKYLVASNSWIVASAKKPEEDKSKASCTLFEPHYLADDDDTHQGVLVSSIGSSFVVRDSNSVLVLPSQVAFKSEDLNRNYLRTISLYDNLIYQTFESGWNIGDQRVAKEHFPTADGNYRIKDLYSGRFWRRRDNWIKGEVDDNSNETLFSFVQIRDNIFGLRSLGNNASCGAYTEDRSINCLNARYPTLSKETVLIVEEVVLQRQISNLQYRLSDSRIHNEQIEEIDNAFGTNNTDTDSIMTLSFHTTDSRTTSWNNNVSINFGVGVEFETTIVPFIEKSKMELRLELGYTHEWGGSKTTEKGRQTSNTVTVPPKKTVKVTMLVTTGVWEVPFSYNQRDLLPSGEWVTTPKEDGVFTGVNSYDIRYTSEEVI